MSRGALWHIRARHGASDVDGLRGIAWEGMGATGRNVSLDPSRPARRASFYEQLDAIIVTESTFRRGWFADALAEALPGAFGLVLEVADAPLLGSSMPVIITL